MDFLHNTAYNHRALSDLWRRENRHQVDNSSSLESACEVYGTPRRRYRPVMGVSGTLQATPNPCMEVDRKKSPRMEDRGPPTLLPRIVLDGNMSSSSPSRAPKQAQGGRDNLNSEKLLTGGFDPSLEVDVNYGVPPHQVHHHHFGWAPAGAKPIATTFSPRRPYGIGLYYAHAVSPSHKKIENCPVPETRKLRSVQQERFERASQGYAAGDMAPREGNTLFGGSKSHQASMGALSTAVPTSHADSARSLPDSSADF